MRAVWVDAGNDADYQRLARYGIDRPYYDLRDPRVSASYLEAVAARGLRPGLYAAWNWWPELNGGGFAERVHHELLRIGWMGNPPVCLDIEVHDISYVLGCLRRWRQLRPTRETDWTLEGMQGGLLGQTAVRQIVAANVRVAPSMYAGDMTPLPHSVVIDLLMAGIPGDRIVGMYDAARLPYRWSGYAFTQGRLP